MRLTALVAVALVTVGAPPAALAWTYVDLHLVLAVDVSGSMEPLEQSIQRAGYVAAFRSPEVLRAIRSGLNGQIAVTYVEWAGTQQQTVVVPWRVIGTQEQAWDFAAELSAAPISSRGATSISDALIFATRQFSRSGVFSDRWTIDVSGDGPNNNGGMLPFARYEVLKQGYVINGLPIIINPTPVDGPKGRVSLVDYYADCVIGGPNSFVVPVHTLADFAPAIMKKLVLEIAATTPQVVPVETITINAPAYCYPPRPPVPTPRPPGPSGPPQ
jgi:hypothetical protein